MACNVTLIRPNTSPTHACAGDLARSLIELQAMVGEGPGVTALVEKPVVVISDVAAGDRRPHFGRVALRHDIRAVLEVPLTPQGLTAALLTLCANRPGVLSADVIGEAEAFGRDAARELQPALRVALLIDIVQDLYAASANRTAIDMAWASSWPRTAGPRTLPSTSSNTLPPQEASNSVTSRSPSLPPSPATPSSESTLTPDLFCAAGLEHHWNGQWC